MQYCVGQQINLPEDEWAKKLADPGDKKNEAFLKFTPATNIDSTTAFNFLAQLGKQTEAKGNYFLARYNCIRACWLIKFSTMSPPLDPTKKEEIKSQVKKWLSEAMQLAYATNDDISKEKGFYDNSANSLQWAGKTNPALGNKSIALQQVRESFALLQQWPSANYLQNAYNTAFEIFTSVGKDDSAYYYAGKYNKLHDSIERTIYQSSISISKLRLNEEANRYNIIKLQLEKEEQLQQRNIIIAAILFLAVVALSLIKMSTRI